MSQFDSAALEIGPRLKVAVITKQFVVLHNALKCEARHLISTILSSSYAFLFLGAVCLNGSPPAYHHAVGFGEGVDNWMVYLEGGGWCMSSESCYSKIKIEGSAGCGNSYTFKNLTTFGGIMSQSQTINPDFYNWNIVFVRYCDGSSYSGDVEEIIQVKDTKIHRRGARLFKAVMEDLLAKGMNKAKNAILAGTSAGGLGTILHCDGFRATIPNAARLKCVADAALFVHGEDLPGAADKRERPFATIVAFHGIDKFLPRSCTSKMDPGLCIFPENLLGDIETPIFLVNSAFDSFQILHNLEPVEPGWNNCTNNIDLCTPIQIEAMRDFRTTLLETLPLWPSSSMGFFIDSCYVHNQINSDTKWNGPTGPTLNNYNIAKAIGDWYFDRIGTDMSEDKPMGDDLEHYCTDYECFDDLANYCVLDRCKRCFVISCKTDEDCLGHDCETCNCSASSISANISSIPVLSGTNYKKWREHVMIVLGCMDLDHALRVDCPAALTSESTADQKTAFEKWERSNRMSLMIMKLSIPESIRGAIPDEGDAKTFLKEIADRFTANEKVETSTVLSKLVSMRYKGKGNIREYIMEVSNLVTRLRALKLEVSDDILVHLVLISLPAQFSPFKISYNTQRDKWTLNELIAQCVQEEERLKLETVESAHLVSTSNDPSKKRKRNNNKGKETAGTGASAPKVQKTQDQVFTCFFCKKKGHMKKDCPKYANWRVKKGLSEEPKAN
ncbi:hypothetical protein RD792_003973 [Penstemon davidsonii]|uniref:CCHC-type domain-containing protein n=1 Tax=Penstemon davidsonii TaxID=160366 RepID=A0ABR0DG79_9LAMI|nr:hypothetical protein RD792_003973 [Penstemon davidsonii]